MEGELEPNKTDLEYQTIDTNYNSNSNASKSKKDQIMDLIKDVKDEADKTFGSQNINTTVENKKNTPEQKDKDSYKVDGDLFQDNVDDAVENATGTDPKDLSPKEKSKYERMSRWIVQAYLNGELGDKKDPKTISVASSLLLDKIGSALVNASQVARGGSPTQESEWSRIMKGENDKLIKDQNINYMQSKDSDDTKALAMAEEGINATKAEARAEREAVQARIETLRATKTELQTQIASLQSNMGTENYTKAMEAVLGSVKGIYSEGSGAQENTSKQEDFGYKVNVDANGNILGIVRLGADGGVSGGNSKSAGAAASQSSNIDVFSFERVPAAEEFAKQSRDQQIKACQELVKQLKNMVKDIDDQVKYFQSMLQ